VDINGEHWLPAPPEVVWDSLHDEAMLLATIPGCKEIARTGPACFVGAATVGIGVIKGLYRGSLELIEEQPPSAAVIRVQAKSGHAEVRGEGRVELQPSGEGTLVRYECEARINGPLAAVGQRLLPTASKALTEAFLRNVEERLILIATEDPVEP
jgi:uncharacterized protein